MRPLFTSSLKSKSSRILVSFEATNKALILLTLVVSLYCFRVVIGHSYVWFGCYQPRDWLRRLMGDLRLSGKLLCAC